MLSCTSSYMEVVSVNCKSVSNCLFSFFIPCDIFLLISCSFSPPSGRYQAGVAAFNNSVYAAGGCDSWNCLNSVEVYDPITNAWRFATSMTTPRRGCGAEVFNGKLSYCTSSWPGRSFEWRTSFSLRDLMILKTCLFYHIKFLHAHSVELGV